MDTQPAVTSGSNDAQPKARSRPRRRRPDNPEASASNPPNAPSNDRQPRLPRRRPPRPTEDQTEERITTNEPAANNRRKSRFNTGLSKTDAVPSSRPNRHHHHHNIPEATDLTSTLIRGLSVAPYIECIICFSPIHPAQPTWSCSPVIPIIADEAAPQYCWSTFHLKCIRSWSEKSFKEIKEAWIARGELDKGGEWRCPGCQGRRSQLIHGYRCFCGSTPSPQSRLGMPHSCGNSCSRKRPSCNHPCPLQCHPGPCPPCKITVQVSCGCPRARVLEVKCIDNADGTYSCADTCNRALSCGNPQHRCRKLCHYGPCSSCQENETLKCWCGHTEQTGKCGEVAVPYGGDDLTCSDQQAIDVEGPLRGFSCGNVCMRSYDCLQHTCDKVCHPSIGPLPPCPYSPKRITSCPCGKNPIPSAGFPLRAKCTDKVPTCNSQCLKSLSGCSHVCAYPCHTGNCPPCSVQVVRPCRCGLTTKNLTCGVEQQGEILCDKPCSGLRSCGRHQCNRICCPLASFSTTTAKGKSKAKRRIEDIPEDETGLHRCDLVCNKPLNCGIHRCEERDHKGICGPCLRSSFEEQICPCSRTIIQPPIPCGAPLICNYPCDFPPPECGHPKVPHSCHAMDPDMSCPPCPHLTEKLCACGKKTVKNVKCSLEREKVGCGTICDRLVSCGYHRCERLCHSLDDPCGACKSLCGKDKKHCLPDRHPCTLPCHAPSACPEDTPCQSLIPITCSCGRITQRVACKKSASNAIGQQQSTLKCTPECGIAKRNARLADALGIAPDSKGAQTPVLYSDELVSFGKRNLKFVTLVEKTFHEFIVSPKRTQVLPHMPLDKRGFTIGLAGAYRLDHQLVDQEPQRSVQIIRRIDTRVPTTTLSSHLASSTTQGQAASSGLGKLTDLRAGSTSWRNSPKPINPTAAPASRGWATVPVSSAGPSRSGSPAPLASGAQPPSASVAPIPTGPQPPVRHRPVAPIAHPTPVVVDATDPATPVPEDWEDDV